MRSVSVIALAQDSSSVSPRDATREEVNHMAPVVSLRAVVDEMHVLSDSFYAYLNKRTGELVTISDEELGAAECGDDLDAYPAWQHDRIRLTQATARQALMSVELVRPCVCV
jgi:hypothetical protein